MCLFLKGLFSKSFFYFFVVCKDTVGSKNKLTHEFRSLFFHIREASCPIILESKIRLWMRPWSPETKRQADNLTGVSATSYVRYYKANVTHTHPILEKYPAWVRGSSAKTGYCCQKGADAGSIPYGDRRQINKNFLFTNRQRKSDMKRVREKSQSPWCQKHMSRWFKGAGQQRLHIYDREKECDVVCIISSTVCVISLYKNRTFTALPPEYSHWSCSITSLRSAWM